LHQRVFFISNILGWRFEFGHWLQAQGIDHEFNNNDEEQQQFVTGKIRVSVREILYFKSDGEPMKWSEIRKSGRCPEGEECQIESGETWILDESMRWILKHSIGQNKML